MVSCTRPEPETPVIALPERLREGIALRLWGFQSPPLPRWRAISSDNMDSAGFLFSTRSVKRASAPDAIPAPKRTLSMITNLSMSSFGWRAPKPILNPVSTE